MQGCFTPKVSVLMKFLFIVDIRTYLFNLAACYSLWKNIK
jgi:hypothetical protein